MAAPTSAPRYFRISDIPYAWSKQDLILALQGHEIHVFADFKLIPAPLRPQQFAAVLSLDPSVPALKPLLTDPLSQCIILCSGYNLVIDQHFLGLTVVYSPPPSEVTVEIIAVHGLSGHAFGSWLYHDKQSHSSIMWLRDFLGEDVPQVRILVYGYEARLDKTTTTSRLFDYRRSFLGHLINYRRQSKNLPLILFGHSFGGTILAQALQFAKSQYEDGWMQALLKTVRAVFFFAVPHRGLRITELQKMTDERSEPSKSKLLSDLEMDSEVLRQLIETLASLSLVIRFVSIYEEQQTVSVSKNPKSLRWESSGSPVPMLEESSAVLYFPNEVRIPAMADHREIIKHSYRDQRYHAIKNEVSDVVRACSDFELPLMAALHKHPVRSDLRSVDHKEYADIQPFAIAFGVSGSSKFAEQFETYFHSIMASYETNDRTHPAFIGFRIQCMRFLAWIELMRAAWLSVCTSGALRPDLLSHHHFQAQLFDFSTPMLELTKQAVKLLEEIGVIKSKYGSFDVTDDEEFSGLSAENQISLDLRDVSLRFEECLANLEDVLSNGYRHELHEETSMTVLASINDEVTLRKIQQAEQTANTRSFPPKLGNAVHIKCELQQMRESQNGTRSHLWKSLSSIPQTAVKNDQTFTMTRFCDVIYPIRIKKVTPQHWKPVMLEWTYADRAWDRSKLEIAKERLEQLVRELSIPDKPTSLRILPTIGVVEDDTRIFPDGILRFGILSEVPHDCDILRGPEVLHNFFPTSTSLSPLPEPLLGERFQLALTLATAVHELHSLGWLHREINSFNVAFLHSNVSTSARIQEPYLIGFGYARPDSNQQHSLGRWMDHADVYRHPDIRQYEFLDGLQKTSRSRFCRKYDIYSLGLVLLEIGLWDSVSTFDDVRFTKAGDLTETLVDVCNRDLGHRMGATYRDVVLRCIQGNGAQSSDVEETEDERTEHLMKFYWSVVRQLAKCHCK